LTHEREPGGTCLDELVSTILIRLGTGLSTVRLYRAAAPFADPALALIEDDLAVAFQAAYEVRLLERELIKRLDGPSRQAEQEGVTR
jgi:hypothetical protein